MNARLSKNPQKNESTSNLSQFFNKLQLVGRYSSSWSLHNKCDLLATRHILLLCKYGLIVYKIQVQSTYCIVLCFCTLCMSDHQAKWTNKKISKSTIRSNVGNNSEKKEIYRNEIVRIDEIYEQNRTGCRVVASTKKKRHGRQRRKII